MGGAKNGAPRFSRFSRRQTRSPVTCFRVAGFGIGVQAGFTLNPQPVSEFGGLGLGFGFWDVVLGVSCSDARNQAARFSRCSGFGDDRGLLVPTAAPTPEECERGREGGRGRERERERGREGGREREREREMSPTPSLPHAETPKPCTVSLTSSTQP